MAPTLHEPGSSAASDHVAVVYPGDPTSSSSWSGIPAGLIAGLWRSGYTAVPVSAEPPRAVRLLARLGGRGVAASASARAVRRAWPADDAVSVVIQIGSEYAIETSVPLATYLDLTVPLAARVGYEPVTRLPRRAVERWTSRQAELFERASAICVAGAWAARSVVEDFDVDPAKVHIVGFGANHVVEPELASRSLTPSYLFIGRDWERKNGPRVVEAFRVVRAQHPEAELHLVGRHPLVDAPGVIGHGPLRPDVPAEAEKLAALLRQATCFVMPSQFEPFGIVYVEAALAGVACIGTTQGPARDILGPDGGLVVDPHDLEALTAAMLRLADLRTASEMGRAARESARRFTWEAIAERIVASVAGGRSGP